MKHTISVVVENKFGVLARVAGLFSARGYNIASLAVSETLDPTVSYMTIVVDAKDETILEQIKKQLNKLIDVITVTDLTKKEHVDRELVLVKVDCSEKERAKIESLLKNYVAKIVTATPDAVMVEAVGDQDQIAGLLKALEAIGVKELVRTGRIAMA
jgi:acetolactate synthase I/III small subunit